MKALHLYNTESIDTLVWPQEESTCVSESTPALSILTDFRHHKPRVINASVRAIDLEPMMKQANIKMIVVVDSNNDFKGVVSLFDLSEENILKKVNKTTPRSELLVSDFMHPREKLLCFDIDELRHATVKDVLEAQQHNHQQHCLVMDRRHHQIRGLISARDIARLLKRSVDIDSHLSFNALFKELAA